MNGIELITKERQRQIEQEGWTPEHDDEHDMFQLARAAHCYHRMVDDQNPVGQPPNYWPWENQWWKPSDDRVRNLVKAGALYRAERERLERLEMDIAAEIDRLSGTKQVCEKCGEDIPINGDLCGCF